MASQCQLETIASEQSFTTLTSDLPSTTLLVLYFHAAWAEPCKQMTTVLSTLASTYEAILPPRIVFASIDAEEVSEISEKYDVTQVPYVVLQRGGKQLETISGSDAARVRSAIESQLGEHDRAGLPPVQSVTPAQHAPLSTTTPEHDPEPEQEQTREDLDARLRELVKAAPVMLFMKGTPSAPQCGFSRQTVALLRERGVRYGFFNILADDNVRQGLKVFSDWPTFPQVYVDGELIGGLDILKEEFENDETFLAEHTVKAKAVA